MMGEHYGGGMMMGGSAGISPGTVTIAFTAVTPGSYQYLCPVPGHAREGMAGLFTVR
jgi:uncharacterized cupredoxin-like copper-binding protein